MLDFKKQVDHSTKTPSESERKRVLSEENRTFLETLIKK